MNRKRNGGFSLIETLIAITVLALIVVPTCTSLVMSHRINAKTEEMMQAQLAVSSAVEMLMAEGIPSDGTINENRFDGVDIDIERATQIVGTEQVELPYYIVTVTSGTVTVTTAIRMTGGGGA